MDKIGIKLANSEFYPILDQGRPARKRLVVTTVNDGQKSVQIDLYRGEGPMVDGAAYVGSLVVEDIPAGMAGEPDVRLDLELDETDMLKCTAVEVATGTTQSLRVSLETLGDENSYEIPDFNLGEDEADEARDEETDKLPDEATSPEEGASLLATAEEIIEGRKRRPVWPWILAGLIFVIAALILAWFFFFRAPGEAAGSTGGPIASPPMATAPMAATEAASSAPPSTIPEPEAMATTRDAAAIAETAATMSSPPEAPSPGGEASAASTAPPPPSSTKTISTMPDTKSLAPDKGVATSTKASSAKAAPKKASGKHYRVKWGDTLWDLAWVYYRDPWLYPRIAKANGIRNPNRILSGTWIVIPSP